MVSITSSTSFSRSSEGELMSREKIDWKEEGRVLRKSGCHSKWRVRSKRRVCGSIFFWNGPERKRSKEMRREREQKIKGRGERNERSSRKWKRPAWDEMDDEREESRPRAVRSGDRTETRYGAEMRVRWGRGNKKNKRGLKSLQFTGVARLFFPPRNRCFLKHREKRVNKRAHNAIGRRRRERRKERERPILWRG